MSLIERIRRQAAVGVNEYSINGVAFWSDGQIQALLEENRMQESAVVALDPERTPEGLSVLRGRVSANGTFDPDAPGVLRNSQGAAVDFTIDVHGQVTFAEDQGGGWSGWGPSRHRWSGWVYDVNATIADLLDSWAAAVKLHYDVRADGQGMSRSQKFKHLSNQAERFRSAALVRSVPTRSTW